MISEREIYDKCIGKAISFISNITKESPVIIERKCNIDTILNRSVKHLANMYYEFETNECLKQINSELEMKYRQMGLI